MTPSTTLSVTRCDGALWLAVENISRRTRKLLAQLNETF
jgi:hypothetical protein